MIWSWFWICRITIRFKSLMNDWNTKQCPGCIWWQKWCTCWLELRISPKLLKNIRYGIIQGLAMKLYVQLAWRRLQDMYSFNHAFLGKLYENICLVWFALCKERGIKGMYMVVEWTRMVLDIDADKCLSKTSQADTEGSIRGHCTFMMIARYVSRVWMFLLLFFSI